LALEEDAPLWRAIQRYGAIITTPILSGLHHRYVRIWFSGRDKVAPVHPVTTYALYNIDRVKLEHLLHDFFATARLDIEIMDRFGKKVRPREWFLLPQSVIAEAVSRLKDGSIVNYRYDAETAAIVPLYRWRPFILATARIWFSGRTGARLADTRWEGLNARARQVGLDLLELGRQALS
jgi:Meiotically up-regulated gene 113